MPATILGSCVLEKTFPAIDTNYVCDYLLGRRDPVPHVISDLGRSRDFQVSRVILKLSRAKVPSSQKKLRHDSATNFEINDRSNSNHYSIN